MFRLLALRTFGKVWARAIALSDKLSEKTWNTLIALQSVILVLSAGGLRESTLPGPVFPDVTVAVEPARADGGPLLQSNSKRRAGASYKRPRGLPKSRPRRKSERALNASVAARRLLILRSEYARRTGRPLTLNGFRRTPVAQAGFMSMHTAGVRAPFFAEHNTALESLNILRVQSPRGAALSSAVSDVGYRRFSLSGFDALPGLGRFVEPARIIGVQLSQKEGGDYQKALLFWVSMFGLLTSTIGTASTAVIAWISVHRGKADALLKQVQIEKMKLEIEQLRVEIERARLEAERQRPRIVLSAV